MNDHSDDIHDGFYFSGDDPDEDDFWWEPSAMALNRRRPSDPLFEFEEDPVAHGTAESFAASPQCEPLYKTTVRTIGGPTCLPEDAELAYVAASKSLRGPGSRLILFCRHDASTFLLTDRDGGTMSAFDLMDAYLSFAQWPTSRQMLAAAIVDLLTEDQQAQHRSWDGTEAAIPAHEAGVPPPYLVVAGIASRDAFGAHPFLPDCSTARHRPHVRAAASIHPRVLGRAPLGVRTLFRRIERALRSMHPRITLMGASAGGFFSLSNEPEDSGERLAQTQALVHLCVRGYGLERALAAYYARIRPAASLAEQAFLDVLMRIGERAGPHGVLELFDARMRAVGDWPFVSERYGPFGRA
jgi:hypothetical protein